MPIPTSIAFPRSLRTAAAIAASLFVCAVASATNGDELLGIGAIQRGTAGAGVASPQDATWSFLNPASIVDLDRRVDVGLDVIFPRRTAKPEGPRLVINLQAPNDDLLVSLANPNAGHLEDRRLSLSPVLGLIWPLESGTLGFGAFGVEGNNVRYARSRTLPGLQNGNKDRRVQLETIKLPLSYAHRFDNGWAVGGALVGVYSRLRTDLLTLELTPTEGDFKWDTSIGWGFKLGVYRRWDRWSFGAVYSSRQWKSKFDKYEDLLLYHLDHPQQFQIGLAYRPRPRLEFVADYKFIDWSGISQISRDTVRGGLGWNDQHVFKLGATWNASRLWTFRAGVSHGDSPVPSDAVFSNVLFPAISETHLTLGAGYRVSKRSDLNLALMHALRNTETDSGTGDLFSVGGRGTEITLDQTAVTLQYSYRF